MSSNRTLAGLTVGATGALLALGATPAMADDHTATVSVLHAVPETPVDVYVNGDLLLDDFEPGTLTDPQELPAGDYDIQVFAADAPDNSGEALFGTASPVAVPAGANATVVAHLAEGGAPTLTPFVNDVSAVEAGSARVTVRHTADAPAVDVLAGGAAVISGLTNPNEETLTVPAGTVSAGVALAGETEPVIGPADLELADGSITAVYAWGNGDAGYQLAVQSIGAAHSAPSGVPGGSAGLVDEGMPASWVALSLVGLVGAGVAGRRLLADRG